MAPKLVFLLAFCVCMCPMRYLLLVLLLFYLFSPLCALFYCRLCVSLFACLFSAGKEREVLELFGWGASGSKWWKGNHDRNKLYEKKSIFNWKKNRKLVAEEKIFLTNTTQARLRYLAHDKFERKNQLVNNSSRTGQEQFTYKIKWSIAHEKCLFPLVNKGYCARERPLTPEHLSGKMNLTVVKT